MDPVAIGKLTVLKGLPAGSEFEITKSTTEVGRNPEADVTLAAPGVSRQHCRITRTGNCRVSMINSTTCRRVNTSGPHTV